MKARLKSFKFALNGIKLLFKKEINARIHLIFSFLAINLGIVLKLSLNEWALLSFTIALVLFAEMVNTVIERLSDLITLKINKDIQEIKDLSAGAVLIVSIGAFIIGLFLFVPKLINLIPEL